MTLLNLHHYMDSMTVLVISADNMLKKGLLGFI